MTAWGHDHGQLSRVKAGNCLTEGRNPERQVTPALCEFYATASCQRAIFISVSRYGRQGFYGNFVYLKLVFRKLFLLQILQTHVKGSSLVRSSFLP